MARRKSVLGGMTWYIYGGIVASYFLDFNIIYAVGMGLIFYSVINFGRLVNWIDKFMPEGKPKSKIEETDEYEQFKRERGRR